MYKFILPSLTLLLLSGCGGSDSTNVTSDNTDNTPAVDKFDAVRTMAKSQLNTSVAPAVSIAIYKDGEIVFAEAFGTKQDKTTQSPDANTLFQIGSTTKMFTALATLQLVEQNMFALDSTLMNTLPGIQINPSTQDDWNDISIHHLLTHQGGFEDFVDWEGQADNLQDFALLNFPQQFDQMNPAGKFWNYSNPNWSYLGAVIQHQTGLPFEQALDINVFDKLGMQHTTMETDVVSNNGNYALGAGIVLRDEESVRGSATSLEQIHRGAFGVPAGGYTWSTPSDMLKMAGFLMSGNTNVLSDELRSQLTASQVDLQIGAPVDYGYGIFVSEGFNSQSGWHPVKRWDHGGNTLAYTSQFWMLPEENIAVSILSSGQNTDFSSTMITALRAVMDLPAPESMPRERIATELFANHEGRYQGSFGVVDVSVVDDQVQISLPEFDSNNIEYDRLLTPIAASHFLANIDGDEIEITFLPEQDGENSIYIRNREFVGIRTSSDESHAKSSKFQSKKLPSLTPLKLQ